MSLINMQFLAYVHCCHWDCSIQQSAPFPIKPQRSQQQYTNAKTFRQDWQTDACLISYFATHSSGMVHTEHAIVKQHKRNTAASTHSFFSSSISMNICEPVPGEAMLSYCIQGGIAREGGQPNHPHSSSRARQEQRIRGCLSEKRTPKGDSAYAQPLHQHTRRRRDNQRHHPPL